MGIRDLLRVEDLKDDNQYQCQNCNSLQDSTRWTEFLSLPPILHVLTLRFYFDVATFQRKKSSATVRYPSRIDMGPFVGSKEQKGHKAPIWYELRGVVEHKGRSAYHGHFVSDVKEPNSNQWYHYDDDTVTSLKQNGIFHEDAIDLTRRDDDDSAIDEMIANTTPQRDPDLKSSPNVYMLVYARCDTGDTSASDKWNHEAETPVKLEVSRLNESFNMSKAAFADR